MPSISQDLYLYGHNFKQTVQLIWCSIQQRAGYVYCILIKQECFAADVLQ